MTSNNAITQATMLKRTHEIQCGKCAMSDYAENIGVWNDDGTLQELGLCGECEGEQDIVGCCEKCAVEIVRDSDEHDNCHIIDGGDAADKFRCQRCLVDCPCGECEEVCSICGEEGEVGTITVCGRDINVCENCDTDGDNYDGFLDKYEFCAETSSYEEKEEEFCWEIDCDICGEKQGKDVCPFETGYADDEYVCDECFMCCGECSGSKNPAVGARYGEVCECEDVADEHNRCIDCDEDFKQTKKSFWGCEECGLNTCEECCENDDGYVMCAGCVRKQKEVCMCVRVCACV